MFSDKIFIVHVYALEISCLCPYKESEISENDTSYFRLPQSLQSAGMVSIRVATMKLPRNSFFLSCGGW